MKVIELHFNTFTLGVLEYDGTFYKFSLNEESTKMLLKAGANVATFNIGNSKVKTKELPLAFSNFLPKEVEKQKLLEEIGILNTDNDFEKLIKISKMNLDKRTFWLKVEDR